MYQPKVGSYAVYEPPEEGWENWEEQFKQINAGLAGAGLNVVAAPEAVKDPASCQRVADFLRLRRSVIRSGKPCVSANPVLPTNPSNEY